MRTASFLLVVVVLLSVTSLGYHANIATAADTETAGEVSKVYTQSYRLTDMPVWSADGKVFDPTILMVYLKATVAPGDWNLTSKMAPYGDNGCLVIATTSANHDSIATTIESLRAQVAVAQK